MHLRFILQEVSDLPYSSVLTGPLRKTSHSFQIISAIIVCNPAEAVHTRALLVFHRFQCLEHYKMLCCNSAAAAEFLLQMQYQTIRCHFSQMLSV